MKKVLIAFLLITVLLAAAEALARGCRIGVPVLLALAGGAALFALGMLPPLPVFVLPAVVLGTALGCAWVTGRDTAPEGLPERAAGKN